MVASLLYKFKTSSKQQHHQNFSSDDKNLSNLGNFGNSRNLKVKDKMQPRKSLPILKDANLLKLSFGNSPKPQSSRVNERVRARCLSKMSPTPSMTMLSEAAEALSTCPSALQKLADGTSTGGVYQVSRIPNFDAARSGRKSNRNKLGYCQKSKSSSFKVPDFARLKESFSNPEEETIEKSIQPEIRRSKSHDGFDFDNGAIGADSMKDLKAEELAYNVTPVLSKPAAGEYLKEREESAQNGFDISNGYESDRQMVEVRSNLQRKRSFSASAAARQLSDLTQVDEEIKAVTSNVAIFKPEDEETGSNSASMTSFKISDTYHNIPKDLHKFFNPARKGLLLGCGSRRERAAYLLENFYRLKYPEYQHLLSVPPTLVTKMVRKENGVVTIKKGSLQRYADHDFSAESQPDFINFASVTEVHKVGILDIRIFNTDRHGGNILCKKIDSNASVANGETKKVELYPIDHALSLPDFRYLSEAFFDWQYYPQAKMPFHEKTLEFIDKLDIDEDQRMLEACGLSEGARLTNKICTILLKISAANELTLYEIATICSRPFPPGHRDHEKFKSPLEIFIQSALDSCCYSENGDENGDKRARKVGLNMKSKSSSHVVRNKVWPTDSMDSVKVSLTESFDENVLAHAEGANTLGTTNYRKSSFPLDELVSIYDHGKTCEESRNEKTGMSLQRYKTEAFVFDLIVENELKESQSDFDSKINCEFQFEVEKTSDSTVMDQTPIPVETTRFAETGEDSYENEEHSVKIFQDFDVAPEADLFGEFHFDKDVFCDKFEQILEVAMSTGDWKQLLEVP